MLKKLSISNYALISEVEIDFQPGLTIITGETGAGKSIMLGALSLLMGARADSRVVRAKSGKSVVEATFSSRPQLKALFETNQLDWDDHEIIIRREVSASGRSRAFINDTPVNLHLLGETTAALIDIHSQNSNLLLSDPRRQLEIIDALSGNDKQLSQYRSRFKAFVALRNRLQTARNRISQQRENENYLRFRLTQLDTLAPKEGELSRLERQSEILSDAREIKERLSMACELIDGTETTAAATLSEARHLLSKVNFTLFDNDADASTLSQRLESAYVELKDIASTLSRLAEGVDDDPQRLAKIEQRMADIYDALKRFKASDDGELERIHSTLRAQLDGLDTSETDLAGMEEQLKEEGRKLKEAADALSETRTAAAEKFSAMLTETARPLGMTNLKFSAMLSKGKLSADGQDVVSFLCSFNKNQELMPVAHTASGGETSRLMLSIKAIIAGQMSLPSIIFDEVDTGVSGEVADRMGRMMHSLGSRIQVIAITHLPQVAAKGDNHYKVYKADDEEKTVTNIALLSGPEREKELAVMLSGSAVDEAALLNARSLLAASYSHTDSADKT